MIGVKKKEEKKTSSTLGYYNNATINSQDQEEVSKPNYNYNLAKPLPNT